MALLNQSSKVLGVAAIHLSGPHDQMPSWSVCTYHGQTAFYDYQLVIVVTWY